MDKFTSIEQFRHVLMAIRSSHDYKGKDENNQPIFIHDSDYPIIKFRGTVKTHGSNSGISKDINGNYTFQSKDSELSIIEDNLDFMKTMLNRDYKSLFNGIDFKDRCTIFGEWIGKGIQKNVAVSKLENKHFIIFAIKIDDEYHDISKFNTLSNHDDYIYNVLEFQNWEINIDFNDPGPSINKINEYVLEVEKVCPIGLKLGISGIGEGIVWEANYNNNRHIFKTKGEKHAGKSKVKIINPETEERNRKLREVADQVTPIWRLNQMLVESCNLNKGGCIDRNKLGDYIRAVINDIIKEDMDIITENGLVLKDITKQISDISRLYFFEQEKEYK